MLFKWTYEDTSSIQRLYDKHHCDFTHVNITLTNAKPAAEEEWGGRPEWGVLPSLDPDPFTRKQYLPCCGSKLFTNCETYIPFYPKILLEALDTLSK